jgi:hypothetical protein
MISPNKSLVASAILFLLIGATHLSGQQDNPPLPGFHLEASDPEAIEVADRVMEALGGRNNWDQTRFIQWRFFGRRLHVWDKYTGRLRFEEGSQLVLMDVETKQGRVWNERREVTDTEAVKEALEKAYRAWINDSYWMFMPYKLKDTGVTLTYVGEGKTNEGQKSLVLQLTFAEVGVTPENKYHVYVDPTTNRVIQWDFFRNAEDEEPRLSTPWKNWQTYGNILLSDDRGERKHSDIAVYDDLPNAVFTQPDPPDWRKGN